MRHILGFVAHSAEWALIMKSADDDWEELRLSTFCDASFGTRCFGGYKVKLTGSRGSSFLIEWASRLQGPQSTSSTQSESIEWRRAAKEMLCVKGALDACRLKPVLCVGYVDNDALRMAVNRGSSAKLVHLRAHTDTCFRFLAQLPISRHRLSTTENAAHIMSSAKQILTLIQCPRPASWLTQLLSTRRMAKPKRARRGFLVLMRNRC